MVVEALTTALLLSAERAPGARACVLVAAPLAQRESGAGRRDVPLLELSSLR